MKKFEKVFWAAVLVAAVVVAAGCESPTRPAQEYNPLTKLVLEGNGEHDWHLHVWSMELEPIKTLRVLSHGPQQAEWVTEIEHVAITLRRFDSERQVLTMECGERHENAEQAGSKRVLLRGAKVAVTTADGPRLNGSPLDCDTY